MANETVFKWFSSVYLSRTTMELDPFENPKNMGLMSATLKHQSESWAGYEWQDTGLYDLLISKNEGEAKELLNFTAATKECGVRFLPWGENQMTYRAIDPAAEYVLTGPLQGCHVYAGKTPQGEWYFYHVNRNNSGTDPARNAELKLGMVRATLSHCTPGVAIKNQLTADMYAGTAFALGVKHVISGWKFYVHSLTMKGSKFDTEHAALEF